MEKSTLFPCFFDKTSILLYLYKTPVLLKAKSYPHNSQVFMWKTWITFENTTIFAFLVNSYVENIFNTFLLFFTFYYKFVHFAILCFFSSISCLEDSPYCQNTCIGGRGNAYSMGRILCIYNLSISNINSHMTAVAYNISWLGF